jgi:hypothetical protein
MIQFRAAPMWISDLNDAQVVTLPQVAQELLRKVLMGVEYRGQTAHAKVMATLREPGSILAKPPNDLPALLRTADQLLMMARQASGEGVHIQYCSCGTRFSFPPNQQHNVLIRCHSCQRPLDAELLKYPQPLSNDPHREQINGIRISLSTFLRDAMAQSLTVYAQRS